MWLSNTLRRAVTKIRQKLRRWKYQEGKTLSSFIACDVRRDILIVSTARIDEGVLSVRMCTTNVMYVANGLMPAPDFEPTREIRIDEMWTWTGADWGGLPDGSSIADRFIAADGSDDETRKT